MCCSLYQRHEFEWMKYKLYMKLPASLIFVEGVKQLIEQSFCIVAYKLELYWGFHGVGGIKSTLSRLLYRLLCGSVD